MGSKISLIILISIQSFSFFAQSLPSYVAENDLEAWWSFENNADDLSQNNHNGTLNVVSFMENFQGQPESSAVFNGTANSYVKVDHSNQLNFSGSDDYTVAMWIKPMDNPNNGAHSGILTKWNENQNTTSYPYRIATTDLGNGTSELVWVNYHSASSTQNILLTTVFNNRYVHIAYVVKDNVVSLYRNGYYESSLAFSNLNYTNTHDIYIGKRNVVSNRRYNGSIDEMGIWSRSLTECEIRSLATFNDVYNVDFDVINNGSGSIEVINTSVQPDNYQWYECINGNQVPISGANSSIYTPQAAGEFAVELIFIGLDCSHNSECIDIQTLDINKFDNESIINSSVLLYPNPTHKHLNIEIIIDTGIEELDFQIIDITGKIIQRGRVKSGSNLIDIFDITKGNYFFQIPELSKSIKFVKN